MLNKIFTIVKLHIMEIVRNTSELFQMFILPLILTFILGQAIAPPSVDLRPDEWALALVNNDQGEFGQRFIELLENQPDLTVQVMSESEAQEAIQDDDRDLNGSLIIPATFSEALVAQQPIELDYQLVNQNPNTQFIAQSINSAITQLSGSVQAATVSRRLAIEEGVLEENAQQAYFQAAFQSSFERWMNTPPVTVERSQVTRIEEARDDVPQGLNQTSPGLLVMFALFFAINGGASLLQERDRGTLRRLFVMPVHRSVILLGKILAIFVGSVLQIMVLILAGEFFFGVEWGQSPSALVIMVLTYALAATSLSIMMAALVKTTAQLNSLSTIVVLTLSALGGAWWPREIAPDWMQQLGEFLPTTWAMQGFNDIITRGLGFQAVLLEAGVLLAFSVAFFVVGVWRFRYE